MLPQRFTASPPCIDSPQPSQEAAREPQGAGALGVPTFCPALLQNGKIRQESSRGRSPKQKGQRSFKTASFPNERVSAIFGRRIPNQGSAVPTDTLGCHSAPGQCGAASRVAGPPTVLPGEDAGNAGADRQRCSGWYPESSTSAGCLATSIPQEPPRPHVPASSASSARRLWQQR